SVLPPHLPGLLDRHPVAFDDRFSKNTAFVCMGEIGGEILDAVVLFLEHLRQLWRSRRIRLRLSWRRCSRKSTTASRISPPISPIHTKAVFFEKRSSNATGCRSRSPGRCGGSTD